MGRDDVLPRRFFAHLDARTNTPTFNIVLIGALTFAGSLGKRYDVIGELLNFGAFLGFMGVNAAAMRQFYVLPQTGRKAYLGPRPSLARFCVLPGHLAGPWNLGASSWWYLVCSGWGLLRGAHSGFSSSPVMIDFHEPGGIPLHKWI